MDLEVHINTINLENKEFDADVPLHRFTILTNIANIELPPEDVGQA